MTGSQSAPARGSLLIDKSQKVRARTGPCSPSRRIGAPDVPFAGSGGGGGDSVCHSPAGTPAAAPRPGSHGCAAIDPPPSPSVGFQQAGISGTGRSEQFGGRPDYIGPALQAQPTPPRAANSSHRVRAQAGWPDQCGALHRADAACSGLRRLALSRAGLLRQAARPDATHSPMAGARDVIAAGRAPRRLAYQADFGAHTCRCA